MQLGQPVRVKPFIAEVVRMEKVRTYLPGKTEPTEYHQITVSTVIEGKQITAIVTPEYIDEGEQKEVNIG